MSKSPKIAAIKNSFWGIVVSLLTILLLYVAKNYPCLRGAGLSMADLEAFSLTIFIALPCFVWAVRRLSLYYRKGMAHKYGDKLVSYLAIFTIVGVLIFVVLAITVIFFTPRFPLRFICGQPFLQWMFKYPI